MFPDGYRETFIQVWHCDPCRGGSDDSCGWAWPKITKKQLVALENVAWGEGRNPHFLTHRDKHWSGTAMEAECLHRGLALLVCRVLHIKLSFDQISRWAAERTHVTNDVGKCGDAFCYLPGYHSNRVNDTEADRERHFVGVLCSVARQLLDLKRPWWDHPRWHFWHWQVWCVPMTHLKRWLFSRCCKCGKRFRWGYAPVTHQWDNEGPRWFRGEKNVFHDKCHDPGTPEVAQSTEAPCSN